MSAIEACRTEALGGHVARLRQVRPPAHRLQLLQEPALPEVPGTGGARLDGRTRRGPAAGGVLPRRLHPAGRDRRASPTGTRRRSTTCCSGRRPRPLTTIAADPKRLGARIGMTSVLHTWGSALTHHPACPHDRAGRRVCRRTAPVGSPVARGSSCPCGSSPGCSGVSSSTGSPRCTAPAQLAFFGDLAGPRRRRAPSPPGSHRCARSEWVVYAKPPFGGPEAVLAYLSRYTHRVAISNSRLVSADDETVDLPLEGLPRQEPRPRKTMTLAADEFIRRFLLHVLPDGFHRIRHYGLFAHGGLATNLTRARALLGAREPCATATADPAGATAPPCLTQPCPCCGGRMLIIERFARGASPAHRPSSPSAVIQIDTS